MTAPKTTTETGNVESVKRHGVNSASGNPTFRVTLEGGRSYLTERDAAVGYAAENYAPGWRNPVSPVVLTLNARGRIIAMARPDGSHA